VYLYREGGYREGREGMKGREGEKRRREGRGKAAAPGVSPRLAPALRNLHLCVVCLFKGNKLGCQETKYFITKDRNFHYDQCNSRCHRKVNGGWWYCSCHHCNLNVQYSKGGFKGWGKLNLKDSEMKVRL